MPANFYAAQILQDTLEGLKSKDEMQEDYDKLVSVCCALEVPVTIARAPKTGNIPQTRYVIPAKGRAGNFSVIIWLFRSNNTNSPTFVISVSATRFFASAIDANRN